MIVQRYNEAEAIIEPFYEGGDGDHSKYSKGLLPYYTISPADSALASAKQSWDGLLIHFQTVDKPESLSMTRACNLPVTEYNVFRFFGSLPKTVELSARAKIDGVWKDLGKARGNDTTEEFDFPFTGNNFSSIELGFTQLEAGAAAISLHYLGLSNAEREKVLASRPNNFSPEWPDMLKDKDDIGAFEPQIGIWFGKEDLPALRAKVKSGPLAPLYQVMKKQAEADLAMEPEKDIGTYISNPDRRWVRTRDMGKKNTSFIMQRLAFVGLIEEDPHMARMAARMALSAAHCEYWCESIMGLLPGTKWHHRSFTEEVYLKGCALVLDWAGDFLAPGGKSAIVDAMAMKGLPRVESDFKRQEYIRSMNQGIVFSSGRIFGILALSHFYSRYKGMLPEAEKDLHEMIGAYILEDGGSPEGPGYWAFTFSQAMPIFSVLARQQGKSFAEYGSALLKKNGRFALAMLSIVGRGIKTFALNDAHAGIYTPDLMAAYWQLTGEEEFKQVLATVLTSIVDEVKAGKEPINIQLRPELFILTPGSVPETKQFIQTGYYLLPKLGAARLTREDPKLGRVNLLIISGIADQGHFHHDKGSFILETEHEALFIDRGITTYSSPYVHLLGRPQYHNLFLPVFENWGGLQKASRNGAFLDQCGYENGLFSATADSSGAWQDPRILQNVRRVSSSSPAEYLIEDTLKTSEPGEGVFILNTYLPCEKAGDTVVVKGGHAKVRVVPEGWKPEQVIVEEFGIDGDEKPVNRICFVSARASEHRVKISIILEGY